MPINKLMNKARAKLEEAKVLKGKLQSAIQTPPSKRAKKVPLGTGSLNKAKKVLKPSSRQKQIEDALKKSGV